MFRHLSHSSLLRKSAHLPYTTSSSIKQSDVIIFKGSPFSWHFQPLSREPSHLNVSNITLSINFNERTVSLNCKMVANFKSLQFDFAQTHFANPTDLSNHMNSFWLDAALVANHKTILRCNELLTVSGSTIFHALNLSKNSYTFEITRNANRKLHTWPDNMPPDLSKAKLNLTYPNTLLFFNRPFSVMKKGEEQRLQIVPRK